LLIKYIKSVLWRVAKFLSYIEEAWCLKVKCIHLWLYHYFKVIIKVNIPIQSEEHLTNFWLEFDCYSVNGGPHIYHSYMPTITEQEAQKV